MNEWTHVDAFIERSPLLKTFYPNPKSIDKFVMDATLYQDPARYRKRSSNFIETHQLECGQGDQAHNTLPLVQVTEIYVGKITSELMMHF